MCKRKTKTEKNTDRLETGVLMWGTEKESRVESVNCTSEATNPAMFSTYHLQADCEY
jgi:hypothetical protein